MRSGRMGSMRPTLAALLDLEPHPEGGWYRETWASSEVVRLPDGRERATATLILFLLPAGEASAGHRVAADEVWIGRAGAVVLELGGPGRQPRSHGAAESVVLGLDLEGGQ